MLLSMLLSGLLGFVISLLTLCYVDDEFNDLLRDQGEEQEDQGKTG